MSEKKPNNYVSSTVSDETKADILEVAQKREWTSAYTVRRFLELAIKEFKADLLSGKHAESIQASE